MPDPTTAAAETHVPAVGLWTTKDCARFLCIHPKTLLRLVRTSGFPVVRVGGRCRFEPDQVARWLRRRVGRQP